MPKARQVKVEPGLLMLSTGSVGLTSSNSLPTREAGFFCFFEIFIYLIGCVSSYLQQAQWLWYLGLVALQHMGS